MDAEDARLALARHATSKLQVASDLSRIATLGFRGEALPSLASLAHLTLRARDESSPAGCELVVEAGKLVREGQIGLPRGTVVDVRRLFFHVPARRKFLRADVTESSHIAPQMSMLAAAYPGVHFRLEHRAKVVLDTPAVATRRERLYQLEGAWVEGAVSLDESVGGLRLTAWLSPPPEKLDVNVHPAKMEVRFVDQRFVHDAVFSVVRNALHGEGRAPALAAGLEWV